MNLGNVTTACALLLAALLPAARLSAAPQLDKTYWNSNWDAMYFEIDGNKVSSEYIFDQGVLTGTLSGDTLRGYWREYNNAQSCGPDNKWSGRIAFLFDSTGKKFTGSWNYCGDSAALDVNGTGWTGEWRDSAYNESECGRASRYWCDSTCRIAPCGTATTEAQCLAIGWFWCGGTCSLEQCPGSAVRRSPFARRLPLSKERQAFQGLVDLNGRCVDAKGRLPAGIFMGPGL